MLQYIPEGVTNSELVSLTGYRTFILLAALYEGPKTIEELNEIFKNNPQIKEGFSVDTLRVYLNSLRAAGCEISRANKTQNYKYILQKHPFQFDMTLKEIGILRKLYINAYKNLSVSELIKVDNLLSKFAKNSKNPKLEDMFIGISMIKGINKSMLSQLDRHCKNKDEITFHYVAPNSGEKDVTMLTDKLDFRSDKLYVFGQTKDSEYSFYKVANIAEILSVNLFKSKVTHEDYKIIYELTTNKHSDYTPSPNEKILKTEDNVLTIEATSKNKFMLMQKVLNMAQDCKVIEPKEFKNELVDTLKSMREVY